MHLTFHPLELMRHFSFRSMYELYIHCNKSFKSCYLPLQKKEKKKNKDKVNERLPFDRERDLKVNQMDDAKKKAIIKRSQELGSRFKSGGTGTTFL